MEETETKELKLCPICNLEMKYVVLEIQESHGKTKFICPRKGCPRNRYPLTQDVKVKI